MLRGAGLRLGGTVTALVGRNGAGKTTLSRCLVGLHRSARAVRFRGEEPRRRDRPEHAYLVMQETGYQLFSDTVRASCWARSRTAGAGPRPDGADGQADRALARFGLEDIAERHPLSLSEGSASDWPSPSASCRARVLVLDEPTSGLDFGTMGRVADEVRRARDAERASSWSPTTTSSSAPPATRWPCSRDSVVSDVLPVRGEALGRIRRAIGIDGRARPL
ncbi:MAG: ATP-binding cassette domain-containing protein [Eggerthellaceae bacterium]